jgi:uncharacterized alkaline shock family protein YloU
VAPSTRNLYGKIAVTKRAIRQTTLICAQSIYGVAEIKKAKCKTEGNRIKINVYLYLRCGVPIDPLIDSIRRAIKHNVETFSGMIVTSVNIDVLGIRN